MARVDSVPIFEVVTDDGRVAGYTLGAAELRQVQKAAAEVHLHLDGQKGVASTQSFTKVAACGAGILWFVAQTVFPSVKLASLAWRLGRLVSKYGARTVARIFLGARNIAGRTAEQEIIDLAKALSGVAALAACDIHETARSVAEEDMMNFRRVERRMDAIRDVMVGLAVVLAGFAVFASDLDPGPLSAQVLGAVLVVLGGILTVGPLVAARRRRVRQD